MKVLLVNPPNVGWTGLQNILQIEPLGLEIIASALRAENDVHILDLRFEPDFEGFVETWQPDVIGISCLYTSHVKLTWQLARRGKLCCPDAAVVVGGHPPTLAPEFFWSPDIDFIVRGDGELTMPELCRTLSNGGDASAVPGLVVNAAAGQAATALRLHADDISDTPAPWRDKTELARDNYFRTLTRGIGHFELTRGCQFRCNFCSIWKFADGKVRTRTIEAAIAELARIEEEFIFISDDHFFFDPGYMSELARAISASGLKKKFTVQSRTDAIARNPEMIDRWVEAGLDWVFLGMDGHNDKRLKSVRKSARIQTNEAAVAMLRERGLGIAGNIIVDPQFGRDDFSALRTYVRENNYDFLSYCVTTPFPGTEVWNSRRAEVTSLDFDLYDLGHAVMQTKLPREEFYQEFASLWRIREELVPKKDQLIMVGRLIRALVRDGFNTELPGNVLRFYQNPGKASKYIADHLASEQEAALPWEQMSSVPINTAGTA